MKKFPFNQLKFLVHPSKYTLISGNLKAFSTINNLTHKTNTLIEHITTVKRNVTILGNFQHEKYSFFSPNSKKIPYKCKIRINECGQKVAEPYEAKKPTCIDIPQLSKDFTMNPEENCNKLQKEIVSYSPPHPGQMQTPPQERPKIENQCPNALTKYLKTRGRCQEVWRGVESNDCKKSTCSPKTKKGIYTGRDCVLEDPCKSKTDTNKPQTRRQKTKQIFESMLSKLKSKKLVKQSGFFSEDFIKEVCWKMNTKGPNELLTRANDTSNGQKSTGKFGVQNLRESNQSADNFENWESNHLDDNSIEVFLSERNRLLHYLSRESSNTIPAEGMSKIVKSKKVEDEEKTVTKPEGNVMKKPTKKKTTVKPKSKSGIRRRRRRPRWFSKIPIEPNIKGSVIFANGNAQELDDPCKILSVNFSASNLHPAEVHKEPPPPPDKTKCESTLNRMMQNYDYVVEKLTSNVGLKKNNDKEARLKNEASEFYFDQNLCIQKNPQSEPGDKNKENRMLNYFKQETEDVEERSEPVVRQKKISKLDKTVKCFTTTVLPDIQHKKRQKKVKKHSKSGLKPGSTDNLSSSLLDVNKYPLTASSEAFGKTHHAMTTNNLLLNFKKSQHFEDVSRGEIESENSVVKIKDITPIYESGDENVIAGSKLVSKNGVRRDVQLMPGITRPLTQKAAHVNLLESKALTSVSSAWKRASGSTGKTRDKVGRKKLLTVASKQEASEIRGVNYQQTRRKSTEKTALSWKSRCDVERKPCHTKKKNYDEKADSMYPLPNDWDYDEPVPEELARKWSTLECPKEKDVGCPITSEDLKKGPPSKRPLGAAALNRCNLEECKNRLRCRKPMSRCRNIDPTKKPLGPGK